MPRFDLIAANSFLKDVKSLRKNHGLLKQLDKKLQVLKEKADLTGKNLHGPLKGKKTIRIMGKFRIIFEVKETKCFLLTLDHRGNVYE